MDFNLPLRWQKIAENSHAGYLTPDIVFKLRKSGGTWLLYLPYHIVKHNPLTAADAQEGVDAANYLVIAEWQKLIKMHLQEMDNNLFAKPSIHTKEEYQALLDWTEERLREKFLSAGRKKP
jgi:hypothetical protein